MFDNIGSKIKMLAQVCCWVIIVACAISGLVMMFSESFFGGLLIIVLGALVGWTSSFMMYGFGDLVESAAVLRDAELNRQRQEGRPAAPAAAPRAQSGYSLSAIASRQSSGSGWLCAKCGKRNTATSPVCGDCGSSRKDSAASQPAGFTAEPRQTSAPQTGWRCKKCGKVNNTTAMFCADCGQDR